MKNRSPWKEYTIRAIMKWRRNSWLLPYSILRRKVVTGFYHMKITILIIDIADVEGGNITKTRVLS